MNCTVVRRRLLSLERPAQPPPDLRPHLAGCPECRAWQRRLLQVEEAVARLPVPHSEARSAFVLRFLGGNEVVRLHPPSPSLPVEEWRLKVAVAFALAAGLAVFALGWWAWHNQTPEVFVPDKIAVRPEGPQKPDRMGQLRQKLEGARTPRERVMRLADLAEEVQKEARDHQADAEGLAEVAGFYAQVVREHLLANARAVPAAERDKLVPVAERLRHLESEASRLATGLTVESPARAASFESIALAARESEHTLRMLARGESA
jgi:hypothetical protein